VTGPIERVTNSLVCAFPNSTASKPASKLVLLDPSSQHQHSPGPDPSAAAQPVASSSKLANLPAKPSSAAHALSQTTSTSSKPAASLAEPERLAAQLQIIKSWLAHVDAIYEISAVMAYRELMKSGKDTVKAEEAIEEKYGRKKKIDA
jgi:hypothetical protein